MKANEIAKLFKTNPRPVVAISANGRRLELGDASASQAIVLDPDRQWADISNRFSRETRIIKRDKPDPKTGYAVAIIATRTTHDENLRVIDRTTELVPHIVRPTDILASWDDHIAAAARRRERAQADAEARNAHRDAHEAWKPEIKARLKALDIDGYIDFSGFQVTFSNRVNIERLLALAEAGLKAEQATREARS